MSDLNIRNIDADLVAKIKSIAAINKKSLREFVIEILEKYVADNSAGAKDGSQ